MGYRLKTPFLRIFRNPLNKAYRPLRILNDNAHRKIKIGRIPKRGIKGGLLKMEHALAKNIRKLFPYKYS